jgi:hypothetical protein
MNVWIVITIAIILAMILEDRRPERSVNFENCTSICRDFQYLQVRLIVLQTAHWTCASRSVWKSNNRVVNVRWSSGGIVSTMRTVRSASPPLGYSLSSGIRIAEYRDSVHSNCRPKMHARMLGSHFSPHADCLPWRYLQLCYVFGFVLIVWRFLHFV